MAVGAETVMMLNDLTNNVDTVSTDGTLVGNSDTDVPTEKAVKTYVDTKAALYLPLAVCTMSGAFDMCTSNVTGM